MKGLGVGLTFAACCFAYAAQRHFDAQKKAPELAAPLEIAPQVDHFDGFAGGVIDGCRYYVAARREPLVFHPNEPTPQIEIVAWLQLDCGEARKVMCRASTASGGNGYCRSGEP